ncbi:MAG: hypothetical protein IJY08_00465 [Clostridia bacterium]|nr:hypothetical protein [Clostridia bacterium]
MKRETKRIITRQEIIKNLRSDNMAGVAMYVGILLVGLIIFVPLDVLIISEFAGSFLRMFSSIGNFLISLGIIITCMVFTSVPVISAIGVIDVVVKMSKISNGNFLIEEDKIEIKTIETRLRLAYRRLRYVDEYVFYFRRGGRYVPSRETYEESETDDIFYVVRYDTKKPKALYVYNTKKYEYCERERTDGYI